MTIRYILYKAGLLALTLLCCAAPAAGAASHGVPFLRSYGAAEYNAHNRNYDIACDAYGTVFVANFEGLVYYDGATWRKIHTPGISRVTRLARDKDGRIWVGGFNVFGYLEPDERGCLQLRQSPTFKAKHSLQRAEENHVAYHAYGIHLAFQSLRLGKAGKR